jgi:hypothetical protein
MDNLKKQLHLVVFGLGILVGVVLLVVGMGIVSGAEDSLEQQARQLEMARVVYSEADVNAMRAARAEFNETYEQALTQIRQTTGRALMADIDPNAPLTAFQSTVAPNALRSLRDRFGRLERAVDMSDHVQEGWSYPSPAPAWSWESRIQEVQRVPQAQVEQVQLELRLLDELCTIAELLMESGRFTGGVRLLDFSADQFVTGTGRDAESAPWTRLPYRFTIMCHPDFGAALINELTRPTALTAGQTAQNRQRHGFPVELASAQWAWTERPNTIRIDVAPDDRARYDISPDAPHQGPEAQALARRIGSQLSSEVNIVQPARLAVRADALRFNREWRALPQEEE